MCMRLVAVLLAISLTRGALAQGVPPDSTEADSVRAVVMKPLVVTATRTDKFLEDVAVPMTVVSMEAMRFQGALRLGDVLEHVPGLMLADDHGMGLQVRGFDAEYTLVLLDGEPIIGRTAGTLDVNRLAVEGLSRLEIIRGPESSLYGSEALAGVVNLVSAAPPEGLSGSFGLRAGTHATTNLAGRISLGRTRGGVRLRTTRYASGGYDLMPGTFGSTTPAFANYETDLRANLTVSPLLEVRLGVRFSAESHEGAFADASDTEFTDEGERLEWSVHPEATWRLSRRIRLTTTLYGARFGTRTRHVKRPSGSSTYSDDFDQGYLKAESQLDAIWSSVHLTSMGIGIIQEQVAGGRYGDGADPILDQAFAFVQQEWIPSSRMQINVSARFDHHSDYAGRLTPKLAVLVRPVEWARLRASVGSGFKAPALRQLYLSHTNAIAGYSVFGATATVEGINRLRAEGQLDELFLDPANLESIGAEHSVAFNAGLSIHFGPRLTLAGDVFHNRVRDLIESRPIARKFNGQFVYGYFNLARMYTRGLELSATALPIKNSEITWSYQYLQARDLAVVEALRSGDVFGRDPDGREYRLGLADYTGLFGRSLHATALRGTFEDVRLGLRADIRARWRSRYGLSDYDGNQIANRSDEFVNTRTIVDITITQMVSSVNFVELELQVGASNVFDHTNPTSKPSLSGRTFFAAMRISF